MSSSRLALFVFIDSLGWEILKRHEFLEEELPVRASVESVFGYSSTCVPTILTGCAPRDHGHFSCFYYAPESSPFRGLRALRRLPESLTRRGRVRSLISRAVARWHGFTGYFQLYGVPFGLLPYFDYAEKWDFQTPGSINGGQPTIFDSLRDWDVPFAATDWRRSETQNLASVQTSLAEQEIRFAYLYLPDLDGVLHRYGPKADQVSEKISWYEDRIRRVLATAEANYEDVRLFVFSDHGQAQVQGEVDLMSRMEALGLSVGVDYAAMWDSTMARFWFLRPGVRDKITNAIGDQLPGRWLSDDDLREWGCDFPDRRYGDAFFLIDPGSIIQPSYMGDRTQGMHGYSPEHKDSAAVILSNRELSPTPTKLSELHGLMVAEARWAIGT